MAMEIASHAWRYATPAFAVVPLVSLFSPLAGVAAAAFGVLALVFHRDPERDIPSEGVVSPADGRVSVVREEVDCIRVGIYMGIGDVHVNRAPIAGTVETVTHSPGANRPAFSKESERNERVRIDCGAFSIIQIAGAFARRIHPSVEQGDEIERGERIGYISFGSRVDVILPAEIEHKDLDVRQGDRVVAGETVLADYRSGSCGPVGQSGSQQREAKPEQSE